MPKRLEQVQTVVKILVRGQASSSHVLLALITVYALLAPSRVFAQSTPQSVSMNERVTAKARPGSFNGTFSFDAGTEATYTGDGTTDDTDALQWQ